MYLRTFRNFLVYRNDHVKIINVEEWELYLRPNEERSTPQKMVMQLNQKEGKFSCEAVEIKLTLFYAEWSIVLNWNLTACVPKYNFSCTFWFYGITNVWLIYPKKNSVLNLVNCSTVNIPMHCTNEIAFKLIIFNWISNYTTN